MTTDFDAALANAHRATKKTAVKLLGSVFNDPDVCCLLEASKEDRLSAWRAIAKEQKEIPGLLPIATMTNEAIQLVGMLLLEYSNTILEELKND